MAVAIVAGLQLVMMAVAFGGAWWIADLPTAGAAAMGGGCALAGTLAYAGCQRMVPGHSASRLMWGHMAGEVAKVAIALGLLVLAISTDAGRAGQYLAGFGLALLAYPVAILLLNK